MIAETETKV